MESSHGRRFLPVLGGWLALWIVGAALSIGRLLIKPPGDVNELLWAEDGLFPLCVRKAGLADCFMDPFAGYLLGVPRLVAGLVATLPMETWGLWSNVFAAILWGSFVPILYFSLANLRIHASFRLLIAVSLVTLPLIGLEAANSTASIYMPLLFTSTVVTLVMKPNHWTAWAAGVLGFLAVITIPLGGWLLIVVGALLVMRQIPGRLAGWVGAPIAFGLLLQLWVVFTADQGRPLAVTGRGFGDWFQAIPNSILHLWPGVNFGSTTVYGIFPLPTFTWTGVVVAIGLLIASVVGMRTRTRQSIFAGLMVLSGLVYSLVPTVTGYASNRYFVLSSLCFVAAAIVWLNHRLVPITLGSRSWILPGVATAVLIAWSAALPASDWRATPNPAWRTELQGAQDRCGGDPWSQQALLFSPEWPQAGVTQLYEPTTNVIECRVLIGTD